MQARSISLILVLALAAVSTRSEAQPYGLNARVPIGPFLDGTLPTRTPKRPEDVSWMTVDAFPNIALPNTLVIASNPADNRIYVGSRQGEIVSIPNTASATPSDKQVFMDLRDRVADVWDGGLLGLVFHPEFGQEGSPYELTFYAYYSSQCDLRAGFDSVDLSQCNDNFPLNPTDGFYDVYLRLSRFTARWDAVAGVYRGVPASEKPMIHIRLYNSTHRGGGLAFGNDGHLYLTFGEHWRYMTAQDIENNFDGTSVRLAVNITDNGNGTWSCPAGSHKAKRSYQSMHATNPDIAADEMSGRYYCIPDDNAFNSTPGVLEEICTLGHRNPHRLALDPVTGLLWSGEVGENTREEINILQCGNNYGWPFREGLIDGPWEPPSSYYGVLTDPVIDFTRAEARAIIGGYVYRGTEYPELAGRFIAGDYVTNTIWAITLDINSMTATKEAISTFPSGNLATFGQDNQGNIFMGDVASTVPLQKLVREGNPVPDAPRLLSSLPAFDDVATLDLSDAAIPYNLVRFWSDGALKYRWIFVPENETIAFSAQTDWDFPVGTVLMKHFELPLDETDPSVTTRLETRFLVKGDDSDWYGLTYKWLKNQTDAVLLTTEDATEYTIQTATGSRKQTWNFPSRDQCLQCHSSGSGWALGPRTHQLNRDLTYPSTGVTDNQLRTWNHLGLFSPSLSESQIPGYLSGSDYEDITRSLEDRARTWIDSNCSSCHRPETGNRAMFDARLTIPLAQQGLINGTAADDLGVPGAKLIKPGEPEASVVFLRAATIGGPAMPPLAKELVDERGLELLEEWIKRIQMPLGSPNRPPVVENPGAYNQGLTPYLIHRAGQPITLSVVASDPDGDDLFIEVAGLPPGLSFDRQSATISGTVQAADVGVYRVTIAASDGPSSHYVELDWHITGTVGSCALSPRAADGSPPAAPWFFLFLCAGVVLRRLRRRRSQG